MNRTTRVAIVEKKELMRLAFEKSFQKEATLGNCAQCSLLAVHEVLHLDGFCEAVFKGATGLAGGLGSTTEGQCGALSGGAIAIGLQFGRGLNGQHDRTTYYRRMQKAIGLTRKLIEKFRQQYGGIICKEIQYKIFGRTFTFCDDADRQAFEDAGGYSDKCPSVVGNGVRWAVEIILDAMEK